MSFGKSTKPSKSITKPKQAARKHYDIYSKTSGYWATVSSEEDALREMKREYDRHERKYRNQSKAPKFDLYCLERQGDIGRQIDLYIPDEIDDQYDFDAEEYQ
jgi:hypothetical protein